MAQLSDVEVKKRYLNSYKKLCTKISCLEEQKISLIETMYTVKGNPLSDMPRCRKKRDLSDVLIIVETIKESLFEKYIECIVRKVQIESIVLKLENGTHGKIIRKKFLEFMTIDRIASDIGYSIAQTNRFLSEAINLIPLDDIPNEFKN
jgi:hypothetical protein|nr:DUF1492 domain-containing protein [uncultured Lachnoclostridium sp.]